jgi:serine/threonine-protein kinase
VKPSNILLDRLGRAVLADFGLALIRVIGTSGHVLGTPHYIAPEQFVSSASVTPQTDLYAVGVILYRIFTGHYPFTGNTPLEIATKRLAEAPIPPTDLRPDLSRDVAAVILKAMALEPEARYPDGLALADALDEALQLPGPLRANTDPVREELRAVNRMLGEMAEQLAALNRQFVAQEQRLFDLQLSVQDLIERANVERTDET